MLLAFSSSECTDPVCRKWLLFCFHREERVLELMGEFGLETYLQNFTAEPPVIMSTTVCAASHCCASAFWGLWLLLKWSTWQAGKRVGKNVYGILRAGRSASTEALVLMAPSKLAGGQINYGVAVLLALAHYFPCKHKSIKLCTICMRVFWISFKDMVLVVVVCSVKQWREKTLAHSKRFANVLHKVLPANVHYMPQLAKVFPTD